MCSIFTSGGGPQGRHELERFVMRTAVVNNFPIIHLSILG